MTEFLEKLAGHQERTCIIHKGVEYKFKDLVKQVNHYEAALHQDEIGKGATVVLKGDYSFDTIALLLALASNKNIIVPVTELPEAEVKDRVDAAAVDILLTVEGGKYTIERFQSQPKHSITLQLNKEQKSGLILFSSGSTGKPKAMIHDFDNLVSSYMDRRGKELIFLVFLLFDHIGGINTLLNCLSLGSTIVIPENREPQYVCQLIEKYKVNVLPSSPTFLNLMLMVLKEKSFDLTSLRMITYGTEPMPASLLERVREKFGKVRLLQTFGTSETGIARTSSQSSSSTFMKIEQGDTEYKIVNGELWLKSKTQILGYLNYSMDSFTSDGWFMTGDMAEETQDGYIRILGRLKEIINVGGEKVLPAEVESVVMQLEQVDDCIAYSVPNAITGQSVGLSVTTHMQDEKDFKKLVRNHCRAHLDAFKVPTKIDIIDKVAFNQRFKKIRRMSDQK